VIALASVLSLTVVILLFFTIGRSLQVVSWWVVVPFVFCIYMNVMYFLKEASLTKGIFALLTIPLQTIIVWSFFFNKIIVFWVRPQFIIVSLVFSFNEVMILLEAFYWKETPEVSWTSDLPYVLMGAWEKLQHWWA